MNDQERTDDPGHGEPDHVHDENWNGAAEFGMSVGGLAGTGAIVGGEAVGGAAGAGPADHADEETKQETGTADDADPDPKSDRR